LTFKVTDSASPAQNTTATFSLTIAPATLTISTTSLPNGQAGVAYSQTLAATGGTGAFTWQLTAGTLPAGLTLTASSGLISGTPTLPVTATPLTFKVTDSGSPVQTATANPTLTIVPAVLTITTASLPNGVQGVAYSQTLAATGGTGAYTWQLTSGTLPTGLTLTAASGLISGTPSAVVSATPLTFKVTDSGSTAQNASANLTLTITPPTLSITTTSLATGAVGSPYTQTLAATGGTGSYSWQVVSGTLPTGLVLHAATGQISGTPTAAANLTPIGFKATDSGSPAQTATATLTMTIVALNLSITTTSLPGGIAGVPYSAQVTATGGTAPYTWVASGLPSGLGMNAAGQIVGTPLGLTTGTVTVTVADSTTPTPFTAQAVFSLTIQRLLIIQTTSLPDATAGAPYNTTMTANGGVQPYSWSASNLPAGLLMNTSGIITGTTTAGSASVTVTVSDSASPGQQTASLVMNLNVIGGASGTFNVDSISVGKNLEGLVTISIAPQVAPQGGLPLTLTSGNANLLVMNGQSGLTSQITVSIGAGQSSIAVYVQALSDTGTVQLIASATNFAGQGTITLTPSAFVLTAGVSSSPIGSFTANQGSQTTLTVASARLDSNLNFKEFQPVRVGFTTAVLLSNTSSSVGSLAPTSVTFNGGDSSYPTVFTAYNTGSTNQASATLTAAVPTGFSLPTANTNSVIAFISGAGILPCNTTVGNNLEAACNITLNGTASGLLNVTLTSNDTSKLLLSNTPDGAGKNQITVTVNTNSNRSSTFYVFGLASTGTATYNVAATGFGTATGTVTLAPSGFIISSANGPGVSFFTYPSTPVGVTVSSALLTSAGDFSATQNVAGGLSFNINVTDTDIAPASGVGTLSPSQLTIAGGVGSAISVFQPLNTGSTTLAVVQPPGLGFTTPNQDTSLVAQVKPQGMSVFYNGQVGYHLQDAASVLLGALPANPVQVTITSNDPNLSVAPDPTGLGLGCTAAGSNHVTFTITPPNRSGTFCFYGLASSGSPTFTVAAPGFTTYTGTEGLSPAGVLIAASNYQTSVTTTVSAGNLTMTVYTAALTADLTGLVQFPQQVAGGFPIVVPLGNSNTNAGTLNDPNKQSVTFNAGDSSHDIVFTPKAPGGSTNISVSAPTNFNVYNGYGFVAVTVLNQ
jgi:hypothetical protein